MSHWKLTVLLHLREEPYDILAVGDWSQKLSFYQLSGKQVFVISCNLKAFVCKNFIIWLVLWIQDSTFLLQFFKFYQLFPIADVLLPIAYYLVPISYYLFTITYCLLPIACYLYPITYYLLPVTYFLLPVTYCPFPVTHLGGKGSSSWLWPLLSEFLFKRRIFGHWRIW